MRPFLSILVVALVALSLATQQAAGVLVLNEAFAQQGILPPPNPNCQPFGNAIPNGVELPVPSYEPSLPIWCYPLAGSANRAPGGQRLG